MKKTNKSDDVLTSTAGKIIVNLLDSTNPTLRARGALTMRAIGTLTITKSEARKELEIFIRDNLDRLQGVTEKEVLQDDVN